MIFAGHACRLIFGLLSVLLILYRSDLFYNPSTWKSAGEKKKQIRFMLVACISRSLVTNCLYGQRNNHEKEDKVRKWHQKSQIHVTRRIKTKGRPFHSNKGKPFKRRVQQRNIRLSSNIQKVWFWSIPKYNPENTLPVPNVCILAWRCQRSKGSRKLSGKKAMT